MEEKHYTGLQFFITAGLPYLIICSVLNRFAYWSNFDINIFEVLDVSALLISSVPIIFMILLMFLFSFILSIIVLGMPDAEDKSPINWIQFRRFLLPMILLLNSLIFIRLYILWATIPMTLGIIASLCFVHFRTILPTALFNFPFSRMIISIAVCVPFMCFAFGKIHAYTLYNPRFNDECVTIDYVDPSISNQEFKLIGQTSDYVFVLALDHSQIIQIPTNQIEFIIHNP